MWAILCWNADFSKWECPSEMNKGYITYIVPALLFMQKKALRSALAIRTCVTFHFLHPENVQIEGSPLNNSCSRKFHVLICVRDMWRFVNVCYFDILVNLCRWTQKINMRSWCEICLTIGGATTHIPISNFVEDPNAEFYHSTTCLSNTGSWSTHLLKYAK